MSLNIRSEARYIIINKKGNTVVDLSRADGRSIIGSNHHGGESQQWETIEIRGGWHIKNVASGKYLRIEGDAHDGREIIATVEPFVWHLWPDHDDHSGIRICVPNTIQNVDLSDNGNPTPGTLITLWGRWKGNNQVWFFERVQ